MRKTLLTLAAGLLCLSASAAESAPYSYTFDNANFISSDGWSIISPKETTTHRFRWFDVKKCVTFYDNIKPGVVSKGILSGGEYSSKDVWLVSPAIQLEAGVTYNVTYTYANTVGYSEKVGIYYATAPDAASLKQNEAMSFTNLPIGKGRDTEGGYETFSCTITPTVSDTYYIGLWDDTDKETGYGFFLIADFSVTAAASGTMPGKPTEFTAVPDAAGALKVAIDVTAPSKDASGNNLSGNVTLELLRGDEVIKKWENLEPGSMISYTDNGAVNGNNTYSVRAVNSDGTSDVVSLSVKVGMEIPNPLKSISAVQATPGNVKFVWEKPDGDIKGTMFQDKSLVKVKIEAYDGETLVKTFENLEGDEVTLEVATATDAQKFYSFKAYAVTTGGESLVTEIYGVAVGTPAALPYRENFANGEASQLFYMSNSETYTAKWYYGTNMNFEDVAIFNPNGYGGKATLYSGLIAIPAGSQETLTFYYAGSSSAVTHELEVLISNGEEWTSAKTLTVNATEFKEAPIDLSAYAGKDIQFALRGTGKDSFGTIQIKDIKIGQDTPSGIESIVTDEQEGEAVYYDLMGRRIANPTTGVIYIKVVNGKATRVLYR